MDVDQSDTESKFKSDSGSSPSSNSTVKQTEDGANKEHAGNVSLTGTSVLPSPNCGGATTGSTIVNSSGVAVKSESINDSRTQQHLLSGGTTPISSSSATITITGGDSMCNDSGKSGVSNISNVNNVCNASSSATTITTTSATTTQVGSNVITGSDLISNRNEHVDIKEEMDCDSPTPQSLPPHAVSKHMVSELNLLVMSLDW